MDDGDAIQRGVSYPRGVLINVVYELLILGSLPVSVLSSNDSTSSRASKCENPPVIFNFGDSNSDTGGLVAGLGFNILPPNGRTFFQKPTGRFCDGRLIIDFLGDSVGTTFLNPYLDSTASTFSNGVNFAISGSSTLPKDVPFSLHIQLMQFLHFKGRSIELASTGNSLHFVHHDGFRIGVYVIDIGQNDLSDSFAKNLSLAQVVESIPSVILEIKNAVQALYAEGGRKFWIHNTGPLGCLPKKLSSAQKLPGDVDQHGCLSSYNAAAMSFNKALLHLCQDLKSAMPDATIVYVDIYSIKFDLIINSAEYGFSNPLMACCGFGGPPYNYNSKMFCGQPGSQVCSEGSKYISWDGIHYTEAANRIIATKILSGAFSTPNVSFDSFCN
ncbi:OLC1v1038645C1 [Oldenlandia corymbosa var. corymbosa]|uniref:OLC1v1038645C1 n=1 Tax=Oldenlandia corymbosa var. corymbosa TaxID=529605 RepID=A0AAV1D093_OLDCO|nr:OLC1v1038645C1 [Oldenlandia corymbosa var. corymbosa]